MPPPDNCETLRTEDSHPVDDDLAGVAGTSGSTSTVINVEGFAHGDGDEDTQDSIAPPPTASTSKSNGFELSSPLGFDDSELEEFLHDILGRGKNMPKKGNTITKLTPSSSSGILLALATRLEYSVEMGVEIALRRYSTLRANNLPLSINATTQTSMEANRIRLDGSPSGHKNAVTAINVIIKPNTAKTMH